MPPLAEAGFHVIAPDQRGCGRTAVQPTNYDADLSPVAIPNFVTDTLALVRASGHDSVALLAGHGFGSFVAAWCALIRPDIFHSVALMSAPFAGPPELPTRPEPDIHRALAALARPRKHYQWHYATRQANADL
jgi:pimeloyl-ACP methyl ester carboxylesterase